MENSGELVDAYLLYMARHQRFYVIQNVFVILFMLRYDGPCCEVTMFIASPGSPTHYGHRWGV